MNNRLLSSSFSESALNKYVTPTQTAAPVIPILIVVVIKRMYGYPPQEAAEVAMAVCQRPEYAALDMRFYDVGRKPRMQQPDRARKPNLLRLDHEPLAAYAAQRLQVVARRDAATVDGAVAIFIGNAIPLDSVRALFCC